MSFPNCLPADSYEGKVNGITIKWTVNGQRNLPNDASTYWEGLAEMKAATEHLAHASAKRLGKYAVRIWGSFHNSTTIISSGRIVSDRCHCTISFRPGDEKVHIYVDLSTAGRLSRMKVLVESVVRFGRSFPDPKLSTGEYVEWQNEEAI